MRTTPTLDDDVTATLKAAARSAGRPLAALALERGATVCPTDCDPTRLPGLKWTNPLAVEG